MESELKVLITGGTGLLAQELNRIYTSLGHCVILGTRSPSKNSVLLNYLNQSELRKQLENLDFDVLINTVANTNVEKCEDNFYSSYQANALVAKNLSVAVNGLNKQFLHISTDHFSNELTQKSTEEDIEIPKNNYASTKLIAEKEVLQECPHSLIVRTNFFGWGVAKETFSDFILKGLRQKTDLNLFDDVYYTPIYIDTLAEVILKLIENKNTGVFNIVSDDRITKYQFGHLLAEEFGLDASKIVATSIKDKELVPRPLDMSLGSQKLKTVFPELDLSLSLQLKRLKESEPKENKPHFTNQLKPIFYGKQNLIQQDFDYVVRNLSSDFLTQGPMVNEFEQKLAKYVGAKYAVAMANLTCALHATYLALGLGEGDYIITTPVTFVSTSNPAIYCGAKPLFADIDPVSLNIDPKEIKNLFEKYGNKIKGVIPVHFAGAPCEMAAIKEIADSYGAWVMEDAAHSLGGTYLEGGQIGSCTNSIAAGFSFHPVKNITMGEGGAITTNDETLYKQLLKIRSHGITKGNDEFINKELSHTNGEVNSWYYEMQQVGYNYRITDLQCSLGVSQLSRLDEFFTKRTSIGKRYDKAFSKLKNATLLQPSTRSISGNHLYILRVDFDKLNRTKLDIFNEFKGHGIHLHVHYIPVTYQPHYKEYETPEMADDYYKHAVTLPYASSMTNDDTERVIGLITSIIG
jgi:UDP-4-amino-4,6-dideoxy-N-acetyl-beta-L-altrosamine transaminase